MKIYKTKRGIVIEYAGSYFLSQESDWDTFVNRSRLLSAILSEINTLKSDPSLVEVIKSDLQAPIGSQKVWASGVTYMPSQKARIEESKNSFSGDFYTRVYDAERPELFFKAPPYRAVGSGDKVSIHKDSKWNAPEPELTLFISSLGTIEGYTIGNDMSSQDIEGENPLYLSQAKSHDGSVAIGPCLYVPGNPIQADSKINIKIERNYWEVFSSEISINRMKRKHAELVKYLYREMTFPYGAFLMMGAGIVPPDDFTLQSGDVIKVSISNIGMLANVVA